MSLEIRFYNTLSHRVEVFTALEPPVVTMYSCGPTVYDYAHIGNFRAFLVADLARRFLELAGYEVRQVMNLTDVGHMTQDQVADGGGEDKMQLAVRRLQSAKKEGQLPPGAVADPTDPFQVARYFTEAFLRDARLVGLKVAGEYPQRMPAASQYVGAMQDLIRRLIAKGHAYVAGDGAVYYDVQSFPQYGALSGNTVERLREGAGGRVSGENQAVKRHPADFLLWKPDPTHLMKWDSPWGVGYPGWHIECSAMAMTVLGRSTIDLHTGGEDNIFPHHECEIAQSSGATGQPFARYWLHTRFLLVDGKKMSKSAGNFYTVRDLLEGRVSGRPVDPGVVRFELLKAHYRSNMNFTVKGLVDSAGAVQKFREFHGQAQRDGRGRTEEIDLSHAVLGEFAGALADDLNISGALAVVFDWIGRGADEPAVRLGVLRKVDSVLGLLGETETRLAEPPAGGATDEIDGRVKELCRQVDAARARKDFAAADELRRQIVDLGYEVRNTPQGTQASRKLA